MCDYCDCRSHAELAALSADHDRLSLLLAAITRAAAAAADDDDDEMAGRALTEELTNVLDGHAAREDDGLFAVLRTEVADDYLAAFDREHDHVRRLLAEAAVDWRSTIADLTAVLSGHFLREESDLFPAAHQLLAPWQWETIDRRALTEELT